MKIKLDNRTLVTLVEIKKNVDELLEMNLEEMDLTEDNLKNAQQVANKLNNLFHSTFNGGLRVYIEISDGTKFDIVANPF